MPASRASRARSEGTARGLGRAHHLGSVEGLAGACSPLRASAMHLHRSLPCHLVRQGRSGRRAISIADFVAPMGWDSDGRRGIRHPVARVFAPCEASEGGGRMKPGIVIITILVLVLTGMFAAVAWAGSSTTTQIIRDASDGTLSGHYTAVQMRAALALSLIHISEPTRLGMISYAVFCL